MAEQVPFDGGSGRAGDAGSAGGGTSGLPCEIDQLLQTSCRSCHSSPPVGGAPMALESYADLIAPAKSDPTKRVADLCLVRMQSAQSPMPPAPAAAVSSTGIAAFQAWVTAGVPQGSCATSGGNPYNTPTVCTSNQFWTGGNDDSELMHPGMACISCHQSQGGEAPLYSIAGTIFPTAHEPNDCDGVSAAGAQVVITDANGQVLTLSANSAGNFHYEGSVATPFSAKVVQGGKVRVMSATQSNGDCNSCHTETGANGAPGRIMLP